LISRLIIFYIRATRRIVILGGLPPIPCVAVSLHRSYWDGPLICMLDPRITAVTSRTWKQIPGVGTYLEGYGVIWTEEDVVARASRYVRNGGICWLAPYGFVPAGERPRPHTGAAQIAQATGAPIVCVTLKRGRPSSVLARRPLTIVIGEPLLTAAEDTVETLTGRFVAALRKQER
jgi:1-acyl-sn-glycerol-3-phosphate acyltransferase